MGVHLNLVNKDEGIFSLLHLVSRQHTDLKIEVLDGPCVRKQPVAQRIRYHVELYKVFKKPSSLCVDDIGLAHLTGAVNQKDSFGV